MSIEWIEWNLAVSLASLVVTIVVAKIAYDISVRANKLAVASLEISESQKTTALVSLIIPACKNPEQWSRLLNYISRKERLPNFEQEDFQYLEELLKTLNCKAKLVDNRLEIDEPRSPESS